MRGWSFVLAVTFVAAVWLTATPAHAGSYVVSSCADDPRGANLSWTAASSNVNVPAYGAGCTGTSADGLIARAAAQPRGGTAPALAAASWTFDAPRGTTIDHADISVRLYRYGGAASDRWGVGLGDETGSYLLGGIGQSPLTSGGRGSYFSVPVASRTSLRLGVVCANSSGCSVHSTDVASAGYSRARTDLYGARVRISDPSAATISNQSGPLWTSSGWLSGKQTISFSAIDNVGVARSAASIGALSVGSGASCDYARPAPCPLSDDFSALFDTSELADGPHTLILTALDAAGNRASVDHQVLVDNHAPGAPGIPQLDGDPSSIWRTSNAFTIRYSNPPKTAGAPLNSHDVELCPSTASGVIETGCLTEHHDGSPAVDSLVVPSQGEFRARVRVNDELFVGAWGGWSPVLRFDDTVPGTPTVAFPSGWVNQSEIGTPLTLASPHGSFRKPPSGYASYRVTIDDQSSVTVPADRKADSGEFAMRDLADGQHRLSVVAVSGAGIETPPLLAAGGQVSKDVVPPVMAVSGDPGQRAVVGNHVTFEVAASDQTSGMAPAQAPDPVAAGGYVTSQVDQLPRVLNPGPDTSVSPGDGNHLVKIYATDVAGNHSGEQSFAYTQDTRPPSGGLKPIDPAHPSLLEYVVDERCVGHSTVELSTSPGEWFSVPAASSGQDLRAVVPETIWLPRTPYSTRAVVTDCVGHSAVLANWHGGDRSGTPIGTITPPAREMARAKASISPGPKGHGAAAAATRRVVVDLVDRSGNPLRDLSVRIEVQPRMTPATWAATGTVHTDSHGHASALVTAHTSIRVRAVAPGSDLRDEAVSNIVYVTRAAFTSMSAQPRRVRRGGTVRISGRMLGGHVPRGGFQVALYGLGPRSRGWVPVRTGVVVNSSGYWRASYRFLRSTRRGSFRFRIRTQARPDYPFSAATSQSVGITVRP